MLSSLFLVFDHHPPLLCMMIVSIPTEVFLRFSPTHVNSVYFHLSLLPVAFLLLPTHTARAGEEQVEISASPTSQPQITVRIRKDFDLECTGAEPCRPAQAHLQLPREREAFDRRKKKMDNSRNRPSDHLSINRISKNIKKSPLDQPNFPNPKQRQQQQQSSGGNGGGGNQQQQPPQPQVYNINKNDFRSIVQQLTGTPTRDPFPAPNPPPPAARPPAHNPPRPPSTRLQRIRPPPLAPLARPPAPHPNPQPPPHHLSPNLYFYPRPMPAPAAPPAPSPGVPFSPLLPLTPPPGSAFWANTLESPISAYMRYLECSIMNSDGSRQTPQQMPTHPPQRMQHMPPPPVHEGHAQVAGPPASSTNMLRNPHAGAPFQGPGLLPSPTSQFVLSSPSAFLNLLSPRSPFPLLSPRLPMTPNFGLSPMGGQYSASQPPPSPGLVFPPSPSGFLPIMSPRWRDL